MESKWDSPHEDTLNARKIPISIGNKCFIILVSPVELFELNALLDVENKKIPLLDFEDIDYRIIEN